MLKLKKIKPLYNKILVTAERYEKNITDRGVVIYTSGSLKEFQKVVAVGNMVRDIKVGDTVKVNPSRYAVKKYEDNSLKNDLGMNKVITYNFDMLMIDDVQHMLLYDNDIEYVLEEYEELEDVVAEDTIIVPGNSIIN